MGIGISVILLIIGLVLVTHAVDLPADVTQHIAANTVGWICIIVAIVGFAVALIAGRNREPRA